MTSKTILLIEDNLSDIELTKRALSKAQISNTLVVSEDGQEALDYLFGTGKHQGRDIQQLPTLTLLDLKLPRIDGLEVLRRIRAHQLTRRLPVVILTSSNEEQDITTAYDLGINSYIRKPISFTEFAETVQLIGRYWLGINQPPFTQ